MENRGNVRKRMSIRDTAVMEVAHFGVRTRARASAAEAAASSGTAKRRKVGGGELKFSPPLVQLRSRRRRRGVVTTEGSISSATLPNSGRQDDQCSNRIQDHVLAPCCSSNNVSTSDLAKDWSKIVDLEDDGVQFDNERRGSTPSSSEFLSESDGMDSKARPLEAPSSTSNELLLSESDGMESKARPLEGNSNHPQTVSLQKMPYETELHEFFAAAEKDLQKRFIEKYNYDIVKDVPLEGRYEWVRLKPCRENNE